VVILQNGSTISRNKIEDYISQSHLVGPNGSLTQQIQRIIPHFYAGKTTLAQIIAGIKATLLFF
jgi:putative ATPase